MKVLKLQREINQDVVETLEHALKLARMGEIKGVVGAFKMKGGFCRKIVHGEYVEDIPRAIGELETVKMWLFGELNLYDVPSRNEEIEEVKDEIEKEK